jgi:tetratricopeptide (TPR) repeat protein
MLETLREYAREELDRAGETAEYSLRHAQHYLGRLREIDPILRGPRTSEFIAWFLQEEDNLRAALEWLLERDVPAAAEAAVLLCPYWTFVGRLREGADRMARVAEQGALPRVLRAKVLFRLADLTGRLGEAADAEAPARDAAVIAEEEGDVRTASQALVELAWSASHRGHHALAVEHAERALALASTAEDEWAVARATAATGTFLLNVGRLDDAETMMSSAREAFRRLGDSANEAIELSNLGNVSFSRGDYVQALERFSTAVGIMRDLGHLGSFGNVGLAVGYALLALGRVPEARDAFAEALDDANTVGATREIVLAVGATAFVAAAPSDGARLRGAANALARRHDIMIGPFDAAFDAARESELVSVLGPRRFDEDAAAGALLTLDDAVALARSVTGRNLD